MEGNINQQLLGEVTVADQVSFKDKLWSETKKLWILATPAICTRVSTYGLYVITQAFVGHIGYTELAAYSFVYTVILRFANGILLGMSSALGTLCGQSYGAKQYHMLGVYLQRSWIVMFVASIFLLPLFIFTTPILKLLGQSDSMAYIGGEVGRWLISTLFAFIVSFTCQMYLQSQSKNMIITYLAAVTIVIHIFLSWLLTLKYKLGISGAMLSTVFAFWIPNIGQLIYVMCGGCRDTWKGFSLLAFKDLWCCFECARTVWFTGDFFGVITCRFCNLGEFMGRSVVFSFQMMEAPTAKGEKRAMDSTEDVTERSSYFLCINRLHHREGVRLKNDTGGCSSHEQE
ncbi:protein DETOXIFICATION 22-like [Quercus suber]|uniref:protein DETOXIFICATION 22-like n=1 Tax=Quercus suber TaxID=58331 RepID=UPI0032DEFC51